MVEKADINRLRDQLNEIQKTCSRTEEHLANINGTLKDHDEDIDCLEKDIQCNRDRINIAMGAVLMISFLGTLVYVASTVGLL